MRGSALGASLLDLIFVDESVAASVRKCLRQNKWKWAGPCLTDTLPSLSTERSAFCGWPCWLCGSMDSAWAYVPVHVCWGQSQQELQDQKNSQPLPLSLHTPVSIHANRPLFQTHPLFFLRTLFCSERESPTVHQLLGFLFSFPLSSHLVASHHGPSQSIMHFAVCLIWQLSVGLATEGLAWIFGSQRERDCKALWLLPA